MEETGHTAAQGAVACMYKSVCMQTETQNLIGENHFLILSHSEAVDHSNYITWLKDKIVVTTSE